MCATNPAGKWGIFNGRKSVGIPPKNVLSPRVRQPAAASCRDVIVAIGGEVTSSTAPAGCGEDQSGGFSSAGGEWKERVRAREWDKECESKWAHFVK